MVMLYVLFALSLVFCRFFAGYDSRFQTGRYMVINDPKLRLLLVDEMSFFERKKRLQKDLNKITLSGVAFYIYSLVTLILSVLLHFIVPKTPVGPWTIETEHFIMKADTLNEALSAICIWLFFLAIIAFTAVYMICYIKKEKQRWMRIITYITAAMMLIAAAAGLYFVISEFVSSLC